MRVYLGGKLSKHQSCFLPDTLWFSRDEDYDLEVSKNTIKLEGIECESSIYDKEERESNKFSSFTCRWKGATLSYINEEDKLEEQENFSIELFKNLIEGMRLVNMEAFFDTNVNVQLTCLNLTNFHDIDFNFDDKLIDEIEMIAV